MAKHNLTIRLDDETREWIEKEAQAQYRTATNFILYVLSLYKANQNGISSVKSSGTNSE